MILTEKQFQTQILELAKLYRWECYHTLDSRRSAPGFPDLVLVRERVLFVELKTDRGRLSIDQCNWRDLLVNAGASWSLWRPLMWNEIVQILR